MTTKPHLCFLLCVALFAVFEPRAKAQALYADYTFTSLASPAGAGSGWFDGPGTMARFNNPASVAMDAAGNLYVADSGNHTLRKIAPGGFVSTLAGLAGDWGNADGAGVAARFNNPSGVAADSSGNIYVADRWNNVIRKVTAGGVVTTLAGSGILGSADGLGAAARFAGPCGVAVDAAGNVFVADRGNNTIRKITAAGLVSTLAGLGGSTNWGSTDGTGAAARFHNPSAVIADAGGNLYVADTGNNMIRKVTPAGAVTTLAGTTNRGSADGIGAAARFNGPAGIALDAAGNLYLADSGNNAIRRIAPGAVVTTLAGKAGVAGNVDGAGGAAAFNCPAGVTADSSGNVYVADGNNAELRCISPSGVVTTLAGAGGSSGSADGIGSAVQFNNPAATAVDSAGNIYVADAFNSTIRKITPAGAVTTLAGSPGNADCLDGVGTAALFDTPSGVAVDRAANVYVADSGSQTIRKVTPTGVVTTLAGSPYYSGDADGLGSVAQFNSPTGLAVDSVGNVYVADSLNSMIRKITPAGSVTTFAGSSTNYDTVDGTGVLAAFECPTAITIDAAGTLYVADGDSHTIRKITPTRVVTTLAGLTDTPGWADGTNTVARFNRPAGIAVDKAGNLLVADTDNYVLRKITSAGIVTTIAGSPGDPGSAEGSGCAAQFDTPTGVAVDSSNRLYVADSGNNTIRFGTAALPDSPVVDLANGPVGATRHLDITNLTASAWYWSFVRYPASASAQFSSPTARSPSFTPDAADLYVLRFAATNSAGRLALRTLSLSATSPPPSRVAGLAWSNGVPILTLSGAVGARYAVQYASSPAAANNWQTIGLVTLTNNLQPFADTTAVGAPDRFYRLQWAP